MRREIVVTRARREEVERAILDLPRYEAISAIVLIEKEYKNFNKRQEYRGRDYGSKWAVRLREREEHEIYDAQA